ncbi:MAG: ubiquinone biosynthesis protein COQ9 [Candidatus Fonsibacter sp.]
MLNLNKLEKEKILKYFYKNYQNINLDHIDKDDFFQKNTGLNFFEKEELLLAVSSLVFEDLDKNFLKETKSNINKITKTNDKISFLLNKRFQLEKRNKNLIKKIFIHLIKNNNPNKVLNYIYSVADIIWKISNDRSVDFNYYTKRLILSSVYLKILILIFYRDNLTDKDIEVEIQKSLEHIKLLSQFKIKFNFLKNVKEFFSFFSMQKVGRGF